MALALSTVCAQLQLVPGLVSHALQPQFVLGSSTGISTHLLVLGLDEGICVASPVLCLRPLDAWSFG
jgi:hypothetical protein